MEAAGQRVMRIMKGIFKQSWNEKENGRLSESMMNVDIFALGNRADLYILAVQGIT
jgi:hypothetical protein